MRISALKESLECWFGDLSHQRLLTRMPPPRVLAGLCSAPALPLVLLRALLPVQCLLIWFWAAGALILMLFVQCGGIPCP